MKSVIDLVSTKTEYSEETRRAPTIMAMEFTLTNQELTLDTDGHPQVTFDFAASQSAAVVAAVSHYRRLRFAHEDVNDVAHVLALRALNVVSDQVGAAMEAEASVVLRLNSSGVSGLAEAVEFYLADRDVDSYQSPEERERLSCLRELSEPLRDLVTVLRLAEDYQAKTRTARAPALA